MIVGGLMGLDLCVWWSRERRLWSATMGVADMFPGLWGPVLGGCGIPKGGAERSSASTPNTVSRPPRGWCSGPVVWVWHHVASLWILGRGVRTVSCGVAWRGVVWCGVLQCALLCFVPLYCATLHGVAVCRVVVCCGVVWCGVVVKGCRESDGRADLTKGH